MARTHRFRVIETTWGVAVDVTAHLEGEFDDRGEQLAIRFAEDSLAALHRSSAEFGVNAVSRRYPSASRTLGGKSLVIDRIDYIATDFQEAGVACAVAGWLCEELGAETSPLFLKFDNAQSRYVLIQREL